MVADLARTLTEVNIQRARAEVRKLVGEIRVEATEETIELGSAQSADQALARVAGGSQQSKRPSSNDQPYSYRVTGYSTSLIVQKSSARFSSRR